MKLVLTEEQRMLEASVKSWTAKSYSFRRWQERSATGAPSSRDTWRELAELGWLAAAIPEEYGGAGGSAMDHFVIGQGFGASLVLEPYLSTVVVGAALLLDADDRAIAREYVPKIAEGNLQAAFAFAEAGNRFSLANVESRATKRGDTHVLSGRKISVWDAPSADLLIVLARTPNGGIGLFLVDAKARGVQQTAFPMIDRRAGSHITLEDAPVLAILSADDTTLEKAQRAVDRALSYIAAEACGAMQTSIEQTVEYLKQREQFGKRLAEFQVLRHRAVDMTIQLEMTRSLAMHAAASIDAKSAEASFAAAAAKVTAGRAGRFVGHNAIQLHGGVGMTDELAIGQYLKRLVMLDMAFGPASHHQERVARMPA